MRKAKIIISLIAALASIAIFGWFFYENQITEHFVQEGKDKKVLLGTSNEIWELWRNGRNSSLYRGESNSCPSAQFEQDKCNQKLLKCVLKNHPFKIMKKGSSRVRVKKVDKITRLKSGELAPLEGARVVLEYGVSELTLFLDANCSKLYLPQRIYGYGKEANPDPSHRFDNFERHIFIDKNVTQSKGETLEEMKLSCNKRGMQLLEGHILDAAVFHPVDLKNNRPQNFLRPKLPWTRYFKSEFVSKAQKDKKFKFEEKFCNFLYSKECKTVKNISLPSWMGLSNPLGGFIEVIRNIEDSKMPLVPSSVYFPIHSKWHLLGLRERWDGESFDKNDFDLKVDLEDYKKLETGYRCMQEVWLP